MHLIKPMLNDLFIAQRSGDDPVAAGRDRRAVPGARQRDLRDRFRHGADRPRRRAGVAQRGVRALSAPAGRVFRSRAVGPADLAARLHGRAGREREHRCAEDADPAFADGDRPHAEHAADERAPDARAVRARAAGRRDRLLRRPPLPAHQPSHPALDGLGRPASSTKSSRAIARSRSTAARATKATRFDEVADENRRLNLKVASTNALSTSLVQLVAACSLAAVIFVATRPGIITHMDPGSFMSVITSMMVMLTSLKQLTTVQAGMQRGIAAAQDLFGIIDMPGERDAGKAARRALPRRDRAPRHRAALSGAAAAGAERHRSRLRGRHRDRAGRPVRRRQVERSSA